MPNVWTDERVEELRTLRIGGMTSLEIARHMGLTRGTVMSKIMRIGLKGVGGRRVGQDLGEAGAKARQKAREPVRKPVHYVRPENRPKPMEFEPETETAGGISLLDIGAFQCRYIVGVGDDGLARFCGRRAAKSYCTTHHQLVYSGVPHGYR